MNRIFVISRVPTVTYYRITQPTYVYTAKAVRIMPTLHF